jgi:hypothetical protein
MTIIPTPASRIKKNTPGIIVNFWMVVGKKKPAAKAPQIAEINPERVNRINGR